MTEAGPSAVRPLGSPALAAPLPAGADWRAYPRAELPLILDVALAEIVERGYEATSVRSIASRLGVTVPALYYHYRNKQAILVALLDYAMDLVGGHVRVAVAEAGDDPVARLSVIVEAIALYMAHHPDLAFLDSERRSLTADNRRRYLDRRDLIDRELGAAIADGVAAGVFRTPVPDTARRAVLAMCQGISLWYRAGGGRSPEETAAEHVRIALAAVEYAGIDDI